MTDYEKLERDCDYATKLAVTGWVFKHVLAHAKERGSYRGLIYERMSFGADAYGYLLECGGLKISNEFDLPRADAIRRLVRGNRITILKDALSMCDVDECFEDGNCGWPSETGSRRTCMEHKSS